MQTRKFGKTDWLIGEIGLGCWGLGGKAYGPINEDESKQTLIYAYEHGVNFFDTADIYGFGRSEELIGEMLANKKDIFVATKVGNNFYHGAIKKCWDENYIEQALNQSLRRLRRETIDLYQLHNPSKKIIEQGTVFEVLEKFKKRGKIREYGVSIFDPADGILAIKQAPALASIQTVLNLLEQQSAEELFPYAQQNKVAVIAREPLACGLLTGKITPKTVFAKDDHRAGWPKEKVAKALTQLNRLSQMWKKNPINLAQAALEFVLSFEAVSVVIPGGKRVEQVQENLSAAKRQNLTAEMIQKIIALNREAPYTG